MASWVSLCFLDIAVVVGLGTPNSPFVLLDTRPKDPLSRPPNHDYRSHNHYTHFLLFGELFSRKVCNVTRKLTIDTEIKAKRNKNISELVTFRITNAKAKVNFGVKHLCKH